MKKSALGNRNYLSTWERNQLWELWADCFKTETTLRLQRIHCLKEITMRSRDRQNGIRAWTETLDTIDEMISEVRKAQAR